jgi:hypothetical protein
MDGKRHAACADVPTKQQASLATWLAQLTRYHHERLPDDRTGDGNQNQPICAALRSWRRRGQPAPSRQATMKPQQT